MMLDDEKDLFIKKSLQQDKTISSKANNVFKDFENQYLTVDKKSEKATNKTEKINKSNAKLEEKNTHNLFGKIKTFTAVAASFVVVASVGAGVAVYSNYGGNNDKNSEYTSININKGSTAAD